jgi:hypothetical protein
MALSTPLSEPVRVKLHWNDHEYSDVVRQGRCSSEHLPIADLKHVRDPRVEFEAGQSNAAIEGKHGDRPTPV